GFRDDWRSLVVRSSTQNRPAKRDPRRCWRRRRRPAPNRPQPEPETGFRLEYIRAPCKTQCEGPPRSGAPHRQEVHRTPFLARRPRRAPPGFPAGECAAARRAKSDPGPRLRAWIRRQVKPVYRTTASDRLWHATPVRPIGAQQRLYGAASGSASRNRTAGQPFIASMKEAAMDWNRVEGNWKQMKGAVKQQWGKLTDDDLTQIAASQDKLEGMIQERYGIARDETRKQIDAWYRNQNLG